MRRIRRVPSLAGKVCSLSSLADRCQVPPSRLVRGSFCCCFFLPPVIFAACRVRLYSPSFMNLFHLCILWRVHVWCSPFSRSSSFNWVLFFFFFCVLWILRLGTTPGQHAGLGFFVFFSWGDYKKKILFLFSLRQLFRLFCSYAKCSVQLCFLFFSSASFFVLLWAAFGAVCLEIRGRAGISDLPHRAERCPSSVTSFLPLPLAPRVAEVLEQRHK